MSCHRTRYIKGDDGIPGVDGISGVDGEDGLNGIDGTDGTDGVNGLHGINGLDAPCFVPAFLNVILSQNQSITNINGVVEFDNTIEQQNIGFANNTATILIDGNYVISLLLSYFIEDLDNSSIFIGNININSVVESSFIQQSLFQQTISYNTILKLEIDDEITITFDVNTAGIDNLILSTVLPLEKSPQTVTKLSIIKISDV